MDQSVRYNEKENKKQKRKKKAIARKQVRRPGDILQLFGHHRSSCNLHMTTHTSDRALYARIFTVRPSLYMQRDIYTFCLFLYFFCPFFFSSPPDVVLLSRSAFFFRCLSHLGTGIICTLHAIVPSPSAILLRPLAVPDVNSLFFPSLRYVVSVFFFSLLLKDSSSSQQQFFWG